MKDRFYFPFACKPSPRPRFGIRTYMPREYQMWKMSVRGIIGAGAEMYDRAKVTIWIYEARGNSDLDNFAKSVLDALQGILIPNDSLKHVPSLSIDYVPQDRGGFEVEIESRT